MAEDDIKKDADLQRDKPNMDNGEVPSSELDVLLQIKEKLSAQTEMLEGSISSELTSVKSILQGILDVNTKMLKSDTELLRLEKDEEQDRSIEDLKKAEREKELLEVFKRIEASVTVSAEAESGKKGGFGAGGLFGLGFLFRGLASAGAGIGIAIGSTLLGVGLGVGLGAAGLLLGFKSVELVGGFMKDIDTEQVKEVSKTLGVILKDLDTATIATLITAGFFAVALTRKGKGFGIATAGKFAAAMAGVGLGIGMFFSGFLLGAKAIEGVEFLFGEADYSTYVRAVKGFNMTLGAMTPATITTIGLLLAAETFKGTFTGSKFTMANSSVAKSLFSVGAGISGFFLGLTAGDLLMNIGDSELTNMQNATQGLVKIIDPLVENENTFRVLGTLIGAGVFGTAGAMQFTGKGRRLALAGMVGITGGMALAGIAIGAFFTGISMSGSLSTVFAGDGSKFGSLMTNVASGLSALDTIPKRLFALTGIFAGAGAVAGGSLATGVGTPVALVAGGATLGATLGIGAAGFAIGAFFTGISVGGFLGGLIGNGDKLESLMKGVARGLTEFNTIDGANLAAAGGGLAALGGGLAIFTGGKLIDSVTGAVVDLGEGIINSGKDLFAWFGIGQGGDRRGKFEKIADELRPLTLIGPGLETFSEALNRMIFGFGGLELMSTANLEKNADVYTKVALGLLKDFQLGPEEKSALSNLEQLGKIDQDLSFIAKVEVVGIQDAIEQLESLEETFNQIAPRINFQTLTPQAQGMNVSESPQVNTGINQNVKTISNAPVLVIQPRPHSAGNSGPGN